MGFPCLDVPEDVDEESSIGLRASLEGLIDCVVTSAAPRTLWIA